MLWGDDYDGGYKAWVRWPDGRDDIVPGSRVERSGIMRRSHRDRRARRVARHRAAASRRAASRWTRAESGRAVLVARRATPGSCAGADSGRVSCRAAFLEHEMLTAREGFERFGYGAGALSLDHLCVAPRRVTEDDLVGWVAARPTWRTSSQPWDGGRPRTASASRGCRATRRLSTAEQPGACARGPPSERACGCRARRTRRHGRCAPASSIPSRSRGRARAHRGGQSARQRALPGRRRRRRASGRAHWRAPRARRGRRAAGGLAVHGQGRDAAGGHLATRGSRALCRLRAGREHRARRAARGGRRDRGRAQQRARVLLPRRRRERALRHHRATRWTPNARPGSSSGGAARGRRAASARSRSAPTAAARSASPPRSAASRAQADVRARAARAAVARLAAADALRPARAHRRRLRRSRSHVMAGPGPARPALPAGARPRLRRWRARAGRPLGPARRRVRRPRLHPPRREVRERFAEAVERLRGARRHRRVGASGLEAPARDLERDRLRRQRRQRGAAARKRAGRRRRARADRGGRAG